MRTNGIYPPSVKPGIPKLGECPKGWKTCRFSDVLNVVERKAILEDDAEYQLVIAKRNRGGIEPRVRLRGAEIRTKTQQLIAAGDFLVSRRQIIHGACGLVPPSLDGALVSNEYTTLLPKDGVLLTEYLSFFSHSLHFQQTCFHSSVGIDVEKMVFRLPNWLHHQFHLPPLPEQERIAEVLRAWDLAIGLTDRLIEAKQRLKKGLMQQLLTGRLRFPQFGKPVRKHGELPKGWSENRLGKCLSQIIGGGTPSKAHPEYWNGNIPWATVKDASRGDTYDTLDHISNMGIRESSASLIPAGTILICTRMAVGKTIRFNCAVAINQDLKALFPKDSLSSDYLLVLLKLHEPQMSCLGSGSTVNGIRLEELRNLPILLPDLLEQHHIASCLSACDRKIQFLTRKRNLLQEQKRGLMQKLLTGEVRVPVKGRKDNVS